MRKHETTSRDYAITGNSFENCGKNVAVRGTESVRERDNRDIRSNPAPQPTMQPSGLTILSTENDPVAYVKRFDVGWDPLKPPAAAKAFHVDPLPGFPPAFLPKGAPRGRRTMIVDEWGPYDFARPILVDRGNGEFEILGPKGKWKLVEASGVEISARSGKVPGTVRIQTPAGQAGNTKVVLEYLGGPIRDFRGKETPAGKPYRFGFEAFRAPIDWSVTFHHWNIPTDP
ncbi:MAG: hypothetical protein ACOVT5_16705, partial [Armatimonadaceae bacterium]